METPTINRQLGGELAAEVMARNPSSGQEREQGAPGFAEIFVLARQEQQQEQEATPQSSLILSAKQTKDTLALNCTGSELSEQSLQQLVRWLWDAIRRGQHAIELELLPVELGTLQISIQVQGQRVSLQARTSEPRVAQLLIARREELAARLARWGLVLDRLEAHTGRPSEQAVPCSGAIAEQHLQTVASGPRRSHWEVVV